MGKVGIITINDYDNYGNRLQNYATQEVIKTLGYKVETIINNPYVKKSMVERFKRADKKSYVRLISRASRKIRRMLYKTKVEQKTERLQQARIAAFREFTKVNISETPFSLSPDNIPVGLEKRYQWFVVGSDQVWNPNFTAGSPIDFLTFAPKEKRIAFSASFGISELPEEYIENYRKWLSEMPSISVREEAGAKIVKYLIGREVPVLVDPTLLLSKGKWMGITKPARYRPNKAYLLTYFLGDLSEDKVNWIESAAKSSDLEIVNMADINDEERYIADPGEFIDYINNSSIFCTDSFHGVVFSILFEKPFVVFNRDSKMPSMNSRIDTLLSKFQLENQKWEKIKNNNNYFPLNFSHVPPILEEERNKSLDYLKTALRIKGKK